MAQGQGLSRTLIALLTIAVSIHLLEKLGAFAAALGNVVLLLALAWLLASWCSRWYTGSTAGSCRAAWCDGHAPAPAMPGAIAWSA
jgi:hypothetical protein